jgi:DNA-binding SARP family transcriptional activator
MLIVRVLGGLALEVDGTTVPAPGGRCGSLLAWVALHPGMQPRSRVAARLWPDVLDESARRSLRTAVLDLRRALGPDAESYLNATRDELGLWPPEQVWVDIRAFRSAVAEGRLEQALELAGGELLPELEHDWVYDARDAHNRKVEGVLEQVADDAEERGELATAIEYTHRLLDMDPLAEEHARALIRRLAAAEDRAAALAVYERHRERLRTELRMAPSASTRALVEQIRTDAGGVEVGEAGPAQPVALPVALKMHTSKPLFGRAAELERLTSRWRQVGGEGELHCAVLAGDPGIGKTRLGAELCRIAQADGATVLYGRCHEDGPFPYAAFVEALRGYVTETALAQLAPQHAERFSETVVAGAGERAGEALRLFDAVVSLLIAAARSASVVLAFDDLHWADRPTLRLLDHLTRTAVESPILVLGTYRETELGDDHPLGATLARLRRERRLDHLRLDGLDEQAVSELAHASSSGTPPASLIHAVFEQTEGNPYFVEEFVRELGDAQTIADLGVPESIQDLIGRRLGRLSESTRAIVSAASVVGAEFDIEVLRLATEAEDDALVDALDEAVAAHVVAELPRRVGSYGFAHALVRETLYGRLSATRRARLHGRVGRAIEQRYADDLENHLAMLARHHELSGDTVGALHNHRLAGDAAARVHAVDDALEHYSRALDAAAELELDVADPVVYGARQARAVLRQRAGNLRGALEDGEAAVAGARAAGDAHGEIEALNHCGLIRRFDDVEGAIACHEAALRVAQGAGDAHAEVATLARLSTVYAKQLRLDEAVQLGDRALQIARNGHDDVIAIALDAVKLAALQVGDLRTLDETTARLLELHDQAGQAWELYWLDDWVLLERAFLHIATARWDDALAAVGEAMSANRRLRNRIAEPVFLDALCWIERSRGDHESAIAHGREAVELARLLETVETSAWTNATLGWALLEAGDAGSAHDHLKRGMTDARTVGARAQELRCTALLAWASWELDDRERSLDLADRAEELVATISAPAGQTFLLGAHAALAVARVRLSLGAPERGLALVAPVLAAARDAGWVETIAYASLLDGSCRVALGHGEAGAAVIAESLELANAAGLRWVEREAQTKLDEVRAALR